MQLLQETSWSKVRKEITNINPDLAKLIDDLDPSDEYLLYRLECPWGQHLLKDGVLYLPNAENKWVTVNHSSIDPKISNNLSYNIGTMPLTIVLKNSVELYVNAQGRIIPWVFMPKGAILGLWISLQKDKFTTNHTGLVSSIVAGSKSALLLPKTTDINSFRKLQKEFSLRCNQPTSLAEQHPLLVELAQHKEFPQQWNTTVIYFSRKWLEIKDSIAWELFEKYLIRYAWDRTDYLRDKVIFDMAVSCALDEKNLRPNPYLTDTVKHIFSICQNIYPGYEVAIDSLAVPLDGLQKIFDEVYGLRYRPTFMVPGYLNGDMVKSVYYSLDLPTLMSFSPKSRKVLNKLEDLKEIEYIIKRTTAYLLEDNTLHQTLLCKSIHQTKLSYYHTDEVTSGGIWIKSDQLEKTEKRLILEQAKFPHKKFCDSSTFLRGCIGMSMKKHKEDE